MDSKKDTENIWSLEAMKTNPDWQHLRVLAQNTLPFFNVAEAKPNFDWLTFIPGKKDSEDNPSS
jgi:hypothetical protein